MGNGLSWSPNGRYLAVIHGFGYSERWPQDGFPTAIWDSIENNFIHLNHRQPGWEAGEAAAVDWDGQGRLAVGGVHDFYPESIGGIVVCKFDAGTATDCNLPSPSQFNYDGRYGDVSAVAWRPGHNQLALSDGAAIELWDTDSQTITATLDAAFDNVTMLAWNSDGTKLMSMGFDYALRIWTRFENYQAPDPRPVRTVSIPAKYVDGVISPDGQLFATSMPPFESIDIIHITDGHVQQHFALGTGFNVDTTSMYWSKDGSMLAAILWRPADKTSIIRLWSVSAGKQILELAVGNQTTAISWRPDGRAIAVRELNGDGVETFDVHAISDGHELFRTLPFNDWLNQFAMPNLRYNEHSLDVGQWSPDGRLLAINDHVVQSEDDTSVLLWDTQTSTLAAHLDTTRGSNRGFSGDATVAAWSPDGTLIAVQGFDKFYLFRLKQKDGQFIPELLWRRDLGSWLENSDYAANDNTLFSPDGRYFFHNRIIYSTATGWPIFRFRSSMGFRYFRWVGNMLTGYEFGSVDGQTPGQAVTVRTTDFLP